MTPDQQIGRADAQWLKENAWRYSSLHQWVSQRKAGAFRMKTETLGENALLSVSIFVHCVSK